MKEIESIKEKVQNQMKIEDFHGNDKERAKALSNIIAEIFLVDDNADVNISGIAYKAEWVKEVYRMINHDDIKTVVDNIDKIRKEIRNPKSYLRTALYNAVNERGIRKSVERQGTFDPEDAFRIALNRTYGKEPGNESR